jgi:hypothetical protein
MSHSTHVGFSGPPSHRAIVSNDGRTGPTRPMHPPWFVPYGLADGVGNNEHPPTEVWGTEGGRRYARPLRVVPESGQVSEYLSHSGHKQAWHVLHDDVAGS